MSDFTISPMPVTLGYGTVTLEGYGSDPAVGAIRAPESMAQLKADLKDARGK